MPMSTLAADKWTRFWGKSKTISEMHVKSSLQKYFLTSSSLEIKQRFYSRNEMLDGAWTSVSMYAKACVGSAYLSFLHKWEVGILSKLRACTHHNDQRQAREEAVWEKIIPFVTFLDMDHHFRSRHLHPPHHKLTKKNHATLTQTTKIIECEACSWWILWLSSKFSKTALIMSKWSNQIDIGFVLWGAQVRFWPPQAFFFSSDQWEH